MAGEIVTPKNQSCQNSGKPMGSISILLVDDDTTCLAIVAAILKSWKYEVVTVKHPMEALCTLRVRGGSFDLVITDVHMPDMNGFELQKKINEEFNLPVVFMSADNQESVILRGLQNGAAFFLVKPISPNDLKNLWQYAVAKKKPKSTTIEDPDPFHIQETSENEKGYSEEAKSDSSSRNEDRKSTKDSKRKSPANVEEGESMDDSGNPKKKILWTNALHNQFLEAIRCVGIERAVPKKILELMKVPGLTRENVASHLQKYRMFLKRVSEAGSRIQSAGERSMIESTFRSKLAMAQPYLMQKKPHFRSLQPNLSYIKTFQTLANSSTNSSPPRFGSGQSRLLVNQTTVKQPMIGRNSSGIIMEPSDHPTGLYLHGKNGSENISCGIMNNGTTFAQPVQQKDDQVASLESCTNDQITGYGNVGDLNSSNLNPKPNYQNNNSRYVGFRLASDGRLVGLSTDLGPNRGFGLSTGLDHIHGSGLSTDLNPNRGSGLPTELDHNHGSGLSTDLDPNRVFGLPTDLDHNHGSRLSTDLDPNHVFGLSTDLNPNRGSELSTDLDPNHCSGLPTDLDPNHVFGLSTDLDPNHDFMNGMQSGSMSNVPELSDLPVLMNGYCDDYLGQGVSSTGFQSGCYVSPTTLGNAIQDDNALDMPLSPSILEAKDAFGNEDESGYIFGLLDSNVKDNIHGFDSNPDFLQPYGECSFDIPSEINIIQPPIQQDGFEVLNSEFSFGPDDHVKNFEVLNSGFSFGPDDHVKNNAIGNNDQPLEQLSGGEMIFTDFGIDMGDEFFSTFDQAFAHFTQLDEEDKFVESLFGFSEYSGYDKP